MYIFDLINMLKWQKKSKGIKKSQVGLSIAAIAATSLINAGIGLSPLPFSDWPFLLLMEIQLLIALTSIWNINSIVNKNRKVWISVFWELIISTFSIIGVLIFGKIAGSVLKMIPGANIIG